MAKGGNMSTKQRDRLRELFTEHPHTWIPLPWILNLGIAQYNARIFELRHEGLNISNKVREEDGIRKSWFCYIPEVKLEEQAVLKWQE
jgi:hypothetical protein